MQPVSRSQFLDPTTPPHIFTLSFVAAMAAMSLNVFLPSLPGMAVYFDADYHVVQLSVALYLLVNALMQIVVGPLSDRFGRRPVLIYGFALYILATLGCILAPNVTIFLAFRMMQATVVVGMVLSRAAIRDMVADAQAASLIGYVTMGIAIVPMIGPSIGGYWINYLDGKQISGCKQSEGPPRCCWSGAIWERPNPREKGALPPN